MNLEFPDEYDSSRPPADLLIPRSHQHLGIVRLFFPYEYQDHSLGTTRTVRWSELELARTGTRVVAADAEFFSYTFPVMAEYSGSFSHKDDDPGLADRQTLAALNDATRPFGKLHGFHWSDLDATPKLAERTSIFGSKYDRYEFLGGSIDSNYRLPQFVVDENAQFAWGANLFPDSILIAAPGVVCDQLLSDPRVDCALVAHCLPDSTEVPSYPASSTLRTPRRSTIDTLEMNVKDLLTLLGRCVFPGTSNRPHLGTHQKGVRLQAARGAVLASAALMDDHVQSIATPRFVDPELDIFIRHRELKSLMHKLQKYSSEGLATLSQRIPTELGLAPRSTGSATMTLSTEEQSSYFDDEVTFAVVLSENENPDMSSSFLAADSVSDSIPFEVSSYYVSWIIDIFKYSFRDATDVIQIGACNQEEQRTIITAAKDWRVSCVTNKDDGDCK